MTKHNNILLAGLILLLAGCSKDKNPMQPEEAYDFTVILTDYSQKVVVATYQDMQDKGDALYNAVVAFNADPTNQSKLTVAAEAWRAMREPWEASEAFLFGPAEFLSLDPSVDSWPVDRQQLDDVLASNFTLTPEFIRDGLGPALRGFHTVEYLIFRDGAPRGAATVTPREREYLVAVTRVLADDAATLADSWSSGFANEFANAGKAGSRYGSQNDAVTEMIDGMIAICDEVANGKIADPVNQQDRRLEESQFSWNSLADFQNNLRSVQNSYLGGYHQDQDGAGLNDFVAGKNSALDARLRNEIQDAINKIGAIPFPFGNNLNAATQIQAAQQAIIKISATLETDVKSLLSN